jgi:PAS domain S-box-containing protein
MIAARSGRAGVAGLPSVAGSDLRKRRFWLLVVGVGGAYVAAAKFGINLSVAHGVVTPVWAPSGISLAALLIFGRRLWPAVLVGAFISNATSGVGLLVAAAIAVGNTLEASAGAFLLEKVGFRSTLERLRDVMTLVVLAAGVSTLIAATDGVSVLSLAGERHGSYGSQWLLWWFGDAVGDLLVAPLLLLIVVHRTTRPGKARVVEALLLLCLLSSLDAIVFLGGGWRYPYLLFPVLLWAALRFRQLGAAASSFLVGLLGTWGTMAGTVPIAQTSPTERVQIIQALVALVSISLLVLGATLSERETANEAVARTASLLGEAQALTHIGSWEWEIASNTLTCSDELYQIFGFVPRSVEISYSRFLHCLHPDDRTDVDETLRGAYLKRQPFSLEHRIIRPDGSNRLLHSRGRLIVDQSTHALRMVGTAQDITEQRHAESLRDDILSTVSHELRTPLASVIGFSLTLQKRGEDLEPPARAATIDKIVGQARRLERLLSDLLDVDRLRHGLVVAERQPTNVSELLHDIAAAHQAAGLPLNVRAAPTVANIDAAKLERIVDNLLSNAARHTPPGTAIELRLDRDREDLLISINDRGPGVPDEFKTEIFEIFDRGPQTRSNIPGSGIGLSLVQRLASIHGGRAWVEDNPTGGASFRVLLPDCILTQPPDPRQKGRPAGPRG